MQVPERIVSFYVATCGQNGTSLGSDEKEIILLVYVILDGATGEIIGTKQILVRPDGSFVKNRSISTSSDASTTTPSSPPLSIAHADGNGAAVATTPTTICNTNNFNNNINNTNSSNILNTNSCITNKDNQMLCIPNTSTSGVILNNIANNTISTTITNGLSTQTDNSEQLPIATAQAAGKPLNEAIEEFDLYLRSLSINENDIKLIADGQLPLRQCLHREACAKDLALPTIYNKFSDLRKEFLKFKSGDLSRALVPLKDVKKILQTPVAPLPQSIDEMLKDLNINSTEDSEFYVKESRDMVSVIQHMLKFGHKFMATELVNLDLEPGICSIDDEIDGNCIVRARGLPWQSSDQDIAKFFRGLNVAKGGVALCLSPLGRRNGEALIRFVSQEHRDMALKRHKHHIGPRYIEVYRATGEDFLSVAGGASNEAQAFLSKGAQVIIRMRGLPYDCTAKQVLDFFTTGENPCDVLDGTEGVLFVKKPDGRATGDAFVLFSCESDAPKALGRHRESIGQRYIELFRSTTAEVQQVLNRSMDPKTYEQNHQQPPLIAQLPTMQLSLLPQHLITSGTTKNCIRLRGLPYEALVEHILHFLDDFAKHIIYQGVHMVINAQGQPSGEAFIQMDTEESARLCAQLKHNRFMVFGKKYRYIEVFQCSGDDMNMVLNGGLQSPPIAAPHPHHPASAGASIIGAPFGPFTHFGPATPILTTAHARAHPHAHAAAHSHHHPAATFYPHPLVYWPYPSPPVSPTTYFSQPAHSPTHISGNLAAAQHQPMYSLDLMPTNYAAHPSALSPTNIAIPHTTTNGLVLSQSKATTMTLLSPKQYSAALPASLGTTAYHAKMTPPHNHHQHHQHQHHHLNHSQQQQQTNYVYTAAAAGAPTIAPAATTTAQQSPLPIVLATPEVTPNAAVLPTIAVASPTALKPPIATTFPLMPQQQQQQQLAQPQPLVTMEAAHSERPTLKKISKLSTNAPAYTPTTVNTVSVAAAAAAAAAAATTTVVNGQGLVSTNQCVELYIS